MTESRLVPPRPNGARKTVLFAAVAVLGLAVARPSAFAQAISEKFQIGLSTDRIAITSDFIGAELVVFGALDDADARLLRQQRYDIVVALVGPRRPAVVRRKERTLGLWINRGSEGFGAAPASYALASTRPLGDITSESLRKNFSLGVDDLRLTIEPAGTIFSGRPAAAEEDGGAAGAGPPEERSTDVSAEGDGPNVDDKPIDADVNGAAAISAGAADRDAYALALRRIRLSSGLYNQSSSSVQFISRTLFRADLQLPADLPVGRHTVRAYLFKGGTYIRGSERTLLVVKTGFESLIDSFAARHGVLYGILAVTLAIFTGWFGRILFRRD